MTEENGASIYGPVWDQSDQEYILDDLEYNKVVRGSTGTTEMLKKK